MNKIQKDFIKEHIEKGALRNAVIVLEVNTDSKVFVHGCPLIENNMAEHGLTYIDILEIIIKWAKKELDDKRGFKVIKRKDG